MSDLLYLHGFLSSPHSAKAQQTREYFAQYHPHVRLHIPQLSNYPAKVADQLLSLIEQTPALVSGGLKVIGSSMGGFLASWLIEQFGGRAVLVNPAVRPYELLRGYLGEHVNPYSKEQFELVEGDMEILRNMDTPSLKSPQHYRVMLQTGDETLDYREAEHKYALSRLVVERGGDHSFVNFANHLPQIAEFLGV
ncbi:esterase YqiA [Alteromonas aestuariivivens]|uniref:Esterase YqiA n=1 Tax=Alteromonas aestuariivivens TaxID=1938339 RepID=A0A3D8MDP3_9ALTE|nr:YqiA/YcfP family alpha/beta fold hydrolase [Alteromonas aestuariivivens]RDV27977.1 esterase YqiA [Alteromonas aestuariivivens]